MSNAISKIAALLGSAMLLATAAFHFSGREAIGDAVAKAAIGGMLADVIEPLWLFPSIHWSGLALLAALVAFTPNARLTLMAIALLVAIDAATLLAYLGPFIGEAMLGAAAGLHLVAALSAGKKRQ